jgi:hypothetical protein
MQKMNDARGRRCCTTRRLVLRSGADIAEGSPESVVQARVPVVRGAKAALWAARLKGDVRQVVVSCGRRESLVSGRDEQLGSDAPSERSDERLRACNCGLRKV